MSTPPMIDMYYRVYFISFASLVCYEFNVMRLHVQFTFYYRFITWRVTRLGILPLPFF